MAFRFKCPQCEQTIEAGVENIGEKFECPCGARMRIPDPNGKRKASPGSAPAAKSPAKKPVKKLAPIKKTTTPPNPVSTTPAAPVVAPPNPLAPVDPLAPNPLAPLPPSAPPIVAPIVAPQVAGIRVAPSVSVQSPQPADPTLTSPFDFSSDDDERSSTKGRAKRGASRKGRKKKQANLGWIMVGFCTVLVLGAVGFFLISKNAKDKRLAEKRAAAKAAAESSPPNDPAPIAKTTPVTTEKTPQEKPKLNADIEGLVKATTVAPAKAMPQPMSAPMSNSTAQPMVDSSADAPESPTEPMAKGLAGLVQKFANDPFDDAIHKKILAKPFDEAIEATQNESLRAKYLLLRVRYFLGDKSSVAALQKVPYSTLVAAAQETFWETQYSNSELEFRAAENIEKNDFHNALRFSCDTPDAPAKHIEIVRQQTVLFSSTDLQPKFFIVNQGRHLYGAGLKRMDNREQIDAVPSGTDVPKVEMTAEKISDWTANDFQFPDWAMDSATDEIKEHFGPLPPETKQWPIETFDINGQIMRNKEPQSRVLN